MKRRAILLALLILCDEIDSFSGNGFGGCVYYHICVAIILPPCVYARFIRFMNV